MTAPEIVGRYLPAGARPFPIHEADSGVTPLIDGAEYFQAVRDQLGRTVAGDAVYLLGWRFDADFRFNPDPADPSTLGAVLAEKAGQGVDVRLITSAKWQLLYLLEKYTEKEIRDLGNFDLLNVLRWFGPAGNLANADSLRARKTLAGRVLLDYRSEAFGVHHQKTVVVIRGTSVVAFLGGIDFLGDRLDSSRHDAKLPRPDATHPGETLNYYWHDAGVRIDGPAALDVLRNFRIRWGQCLFQTNRSFTLISGRRIPSLNPAAEVTEPKRVTSVGKAREPVRAVQVVANFPEKDVAGSFPLDETGDSGYGRIHSTGDLYQRAIRAARTYIYVEDQYVSAPETLYPALAEAARRGVKVIGVLGAYDDDSQKPVSRVIPPGPQHDFLTRLGPAAENVCIYHVLNTIVHSKLMIVDDEFFVIGSANFADRSMSEATYTSGIAKVYAEATGKPPGATDSELSAAVVDDRPGPDNSARRLRIRLWAEHLRVDQHDPKVRADLTDLGRALSVFDGKWGRPVRFEAPASRLVRATLD